MSNFNPSQRLLLAILAIALSSLACVFQKASLIHTGFQSTDQCRGIDIGIPFQQAGSSATSLEYTNNLYSKDGEPTGEITISGRLSCSWEEPYQSAEKVGIVRAYLQIFTIKDPSQAQALFSSYSEQVVAKPAYCQEDQFCSVAVESFGDDRVYYVEKNIYAHGSGDLLPSYHSGHLVRLLPGPGETYVLDLTVDHPELDPDSNFVTGVVSKIENSLAPKTEESQSSAIPE
jgi:hypothetical protein